MRNFWNTKENQQFTQAKIFLFLLVFVGLTVALSPVRAMAATFTVTTLADDETDGCGSGQCTLREAIDEANAAAGADTIEFAAGASSGSIVLANGQLAITDDLTINGSGARNLIVDGNNLSRVFLIASPPASADFTVNINALTVTGGNATPLLIGTTLIGDGGGILNGALLDIIGGVSTLNLNDSVVSGNSTTTLGGGVATRINAVTNINRSLIAGNFANPVTPVDDGSVGGGGVANTLGATTTIVNSTITDNQSLAVGGGILNAVGTVNLTNDTVSHNDSTLAGGGAVSILGIVTPILGVTNLRNTIIAENNDLLGTDLLGRDVVGELGSFNSLGNNLIGSRFGAAANFEASGFVGATPIPNTNLDLVGDGELGNQIIDPLLGALADNGGATDTRAITSASPAFNLGNPCVINNNCANNADGNNPPFSLTTDQRGGIFSRLSGASVDIGAYELQLGVTSSGVRISGYALNFRGRGIENLSVTMTDSGGTTRTVNTDASGFYHFDDIESGGMYVVAAEDKSNSFVRQTYVLNVVEDVEDVNFITRGIRSFSPIIKPPSTLRK